MPMILGMGLMQTANLVVVFNGQKKIQKQLLRETIQRVQKDSELQYILLSLYGGSALFSNDSVRFVNRTFESIFVKSDQAFE